ncbi:bidirectional sugar transporter SWEET3b-like [Telopea speciosissima]|uniref:bidirectional sugar transporter SWEET3b-like n=1 Tax=Telopea speciosissima TaxID=54955 RepID=UPI001CC5B02D|nr:bidirectional sugar transporter SWEET3b-like [Telopea speciosissima]
MSWFLSTMHSRLPSAALLESNLSFTADVQSLSWVFSTETITQLRFAIGMIGNAASLLLYAAPILTFRRVIQKRTTGEFSCIPYITALLNCLIYVWYGLPLVSNGWENLPLVTINSVGIMLELSFIFIYLWFASARARKLVSLILLPAIIAFCIGVVVLSITLHDHHLRKAMVGSIGLVVSIGMYSSPLVVVKQVIETNSVEFMPFYLSFFSFLTSLLWMMYGILSWDILLTAPNLLACPVGLLQLVLYCMHRKNQGVPEERYKLDLEHNGTDLESQQPLLTDCNNEKN